MKKEKNILNGASSNDLISLRTFKNLFMNLQIAIPKNQKEKELHITVLYDRLPQFEFRFFIYNAVLKNCRVAPSNESLRLHNCI